MIRILEADVAKRADVICGLDAVCFPEDALPALTGVRWWIAWDRDNPVGYVAANFDELSIDRYGVVPSHRRRGLGRRLVRVAISKLRKAGARKVSAYTSADNGDSINVFIALGFRWAKCEKARGGTNGRVYWFQTWSRNFSPKRT